MSYKTKCAFPGCNNPTASESKHNARFSRMYCEKHSKGIDVECSICHKKYHARISDYMPILKANKPIICAHCTIVARNKTPEMREQARQLGYKTGKINAEIAHKKWSRSEKGRAYAKHLGDTIGKYNCIAYVNSEAGHKNAAKQGKKYGPITGKINITKYNKSDKGRATSARIGKLIGKYNLINWISTQEGKEWAHKLGSKYGGINIFGHYSNANNARQAFYENKLSLISFKSLDKPIELEDIDKFKNIGIVFSKELYSKNGNRLLCLDVGQSKNGQKELLFGIRALSWAYENLDMPKDDMIDKNLSNIDTRLKYQSMLKETNKYNANFVIKIIAIEPDKEKRLKIEAQYAHDTQAEFWSPEPGQIQLILNSPLTYNQN
jgi:hypothetical protein